MIARDAAQGSGDGYLAGGAAISYSVLRRGSGECGPIADGSIDRQDFSKRHFRIYG